MRRFTKAEDGTELVEFSLVMLPLFGFLFLILSVCWVIFAQATLQYAATAGVRFAITRQTNAAIIAVVQQNSLGFIPNPSRQIQISYFNPSNPKQATGNGPGNVVQISISGVQLGPLAPILGGSSAASTITVSAADVME